MVQSNAIKKTLVYVLIGLVLGAGFFPSIIANQSQKFTDVGAAITLSLAHHAASLKLQDLNKNDFLIIESIQIHDETIILRV